MSKTVAVKHEKRDMSANEIPGGNGWKSKLERTDKDKVVACVTNVVLAVGMHPYLYDCFAWSEVEEKVMIMRPLPTYDGLKSPRSASGYPCTIDDKHAVYIRCMLNSILGCNFKASDVNDGLITIANQRPYHPIRTYLKSLTWDEEPRLSDWLVKGFGATPGPLVGSMSHMFLIAAVRRVIFRRYKFDSMLVLEGAKGIKKSSGIRALYGDEYFLEGVGDIRREQSTQILSGMWGVEIPEGKGFLQADAATQKAFLSQVEDTYRRAYAHHAVSIPRTVTFIMTVNDYNYMIDGVGDRRFWPVRCGETSMPDIEWIRANRDQLWAEAFVKATERNEDGTLKYQTFMEDTEMGVLTDQQEDRVIVDPWESLIHHYLYTDTGGSGVKEVSTVRLMADALEIPKDRQDKTAQVKVGRIMRDMGWTKTRIGSRHNREYVYTRP